MSNQDEFLNDQFHQLLEECKTPGEAAKILLESRRSVAEVCNRLLEKLNSGDCEQLLKDLDAQEATDDNDKR